MRRLLTVGTVLFLVTGSFGSVGSVEQSTVMEQAQYTGPSQCDGQTPHPPIRITEDEGPQGFILGDRSPTGDPIYRPGSGVTAGNGTADDPYQIEGWCIAPNPSGVGIHVEDTKAHLVIRDNKLDGRTDETHGGQATGILLHNVENATLSHNEITDHDDTWFEPGTREGGLVIRYSSNIGVVDNTFTSNFQGDLHISGSEAITVADNLFQNKENGLGISLNDATEIKLVGNDFLYSAPSIEDSTEIDLRENHIFEGPSLQLWNTQGIRFSNNTVERSDTVFIEDARHVDFVDNLVEDSFNWGLIVRRSSDVGIHRNNIEDNKLGGLLLQSMIDPLDATANWWGASNGPSGGIGDACTGTTADGDGDKIGTVEDGSMICFDPWLESPNPDAGAG